ncbi:MULTISPECIES: AAA family ATPase [unclassified Pseudomonas]|uniref:AAA family ATPase n=3 Tax=Pseudomonas TaxID=286 RepID=UPI001A9F309C
MSHIESFGVRNLRSFGSKKQLIPIKKINIFVGKNSCGKSTFLRTYPLLRQSVESNTRSPILWYGAFVDFGDLSTATHDGADEIFFDFKSVLDVDRSHPERIIVQDFSARHDQQRLSNSATFATDISIGLKNHNTQVVSSSVIRIHNTEIVIKYTTTEKLEVTTRQYLWGADDEECGVAVDEHTYSDLIMLTKSSLIPTKIYGTREAKDGSDRLVRYLDEKAIPIAATKNLVSFLKPYASNSSKTIGQKVEDLYINSPDVLISDLKKIFRNDKKFQESLLSSGEFIAETCFYHLTIKNLEKILEAADASFKKLFSGVRYLGPLRASAERFYRHQDLQVGEVDHKGENLPMVINSLDQRKKRQLSTWISEKFGFELELAATGLHYELKIKEDNDSKFHNISDMGFGYSQILPVIVSMWLELEATADRYPRGFMPSHSRTLVIEQPELHLHPALQYKFGAALAQIASMSKSRDFRIVIETHSSQMIEAIGEGVRRNIITGDDINITLFEKNDNDCTDITLSGFDSEGYLTNWPAGFLSA